MSFIDLAERLVLPDWLIRLGIRRLLAKRIRHVTRENVAKQQDAQRDFIRKLRQSPIAIETDAANVQHYEVPTTFFQQVLGPRLKYSCCCYAAPETRLPEAEEEMLDHVAYPFETEGKDDWMGRHFFTGGIMPSFDLLMHFQQDLVMENRWAVSGTHYARTLEDWLRKCDAQRDELLPIFQSDLDPVDGKLQFQRWRIFFMACAELFAYRAGNEWFVAHYLFAKRQIEENT